MAVYITGDCHGNFKKVQDFCKKNETTREDIMIVLGDAGINFNKNILDLQRKIGISQLPITLFCIHGNHDARPSSLKNMDYFEFKELPGKMYHLKPWHGGKVYIESSFPNILFAKDGEVFDFNGLKTLVCGGAYSPDKNYRLAKGWPWYADEQPSTRIKHQVEKKIKEMNYHVDVMLTHTIPYKYISQLGLEPWEGIDNSTEIWLDQIEESLDYDKWYAGHFHVDQKIGHLQVMMDAIEPFYTKEIE